MVFFNSSLQTRIQRETNDLRINSESFGLYCK
jgi:hypothetical protein